MKSDLIDIEVRVLNETDRAYRVDFGGKETVWVPKSQCEFEYREGIEINGVLTLPEWLALEKGLI
jgi:RNase P/RNase MRP subunit p29